MVEEVRVEGIFVGTEWGESGFGVGDGWVGGYFGQWYLGLSEVLGADAEIL